MRREFVQVCIYKIHGETDNIHYVYGEILLNSGLIEVNSSKMVVKL